MLRRVSVSEWVVIGALVLTGLTWLVRLEGRVDGTATAIATVKADQKDALAALRDDVRYIRERLDRALDEARR